MSLHSVTLASQTDLDGFRREARVLLATLVPPEEVEWNAPQGVAITPSCAVANGGKRHSADRPHGGVNLFLPRSFMSLCDVVILHSDPGRFDLLYRLLWRLVHEPGLRRSPLDSDRVRAVHMAQAVRRDIQRTKALIRFRPVDSGVEGAPLHIAWLEPDHYIVEAIAPFFARRFAQMNWAILTPTCSVRWNREALEFGPGVDKPDEGLWLTRYRQAFESPRSTGGCNEPPELRTDTGSAPAQSSRLGSAL